MLNNKLKRCCDVCAYAAIKTDIRPPFLARIIDGKPDGELVPYCVTISCEHIHVCKEYQEEDDE